LKMRLWHDARATCQWFLPHSAKEQDMTEHYDFIFIGAGPGGYVGAIRAAQLKARVCVVEKNKVGGTCLHQGCIPSKALIASIVRYRHALSSEEFGIRAESVALDWSRCVQRKNAIVSQLEQGIHYLFKKNNVVLKSGTARLLDHSRVMAADEKGSKSELRGERIIIASGSEPALIPAFSIDRTTILTSTEALNLEQLPESLFIVGGGVIGCEFASLFNGAGVKVTVLEALPTLLGLTTLDDLIIKQLQAHFKKQGVTIVTKASIQSLKSDPQRGGAVAILENGQTYGAEKAIVSIGRSLNTQGLGLHEVGIECGPKGEILVNERLETNVRSVIAIGDVIGKWQLAHVASKQGICAVETALGRPVTTNFDVVPSCIFTDPPVAFVGLSERVATEKNIDVKVGKFYYRALGKALAEGEADGVIKVVSDEKHDTILGVHIFGHGSPELIHEACVAMQNKLPCSALTAAIHAHPTYSEALLEAFEAVHGMSIHS
jgi:dihydrolipoamide dehydrogenase